jgi:molybdopterin-guanine dinucleotide biosynthesis protein A
MAVIRHQPSSRGAKPGHTPPAAGNPVEGVILAGGRSLRMGRDKTRLRLGGKSFLRIIRGVVQNAGFPCRVLRRDRNPGLGPLGGIETALASTRARAVLLLSCDMPFVTEALLRRVVARSRGGRRAVFLSGDEGDGFPCLVPAGERARVERRVARRQLSLQGLAREVRGLRVRLRKGRDWERTNVNTPDEFQRATALWRRRSLRRRPAVRPPSPSVGGRRGRRG